MYRVKLLIMRTFYVDPGGDLPLQALGFRALGFQDLEVEGARKAHGSFRI